MLPIPNVSLMAILIFGHRLAKSTLVLIPLLGVHEMIFSFITDDHVIGFQRHLRLVFQLTLSSIHVSRHKKQVKIKRTQK